MSARDDLRQRNKKTSYNEGESEEDSNNDTSYVSNVSLDKSLTPGQKRDTSVYKSFLESSSNSSPGSSFLSNPSPFASRNTHQNSPTPTKRIYPQLDISSKNAEFSASCSDVDSSPRRIQKESAENSKIYPDLKKLSSEHSDQGNHSKNLFVFIMFIIILVFAYLIWPFINPRELASSPEKRTVQVLPFEKFIHDMKQLQSNLPSQNDRLWRTIKASVKHILNETSSEYPSIILMASQSKDSSTARCVANQIAAIFQSVNKLNTPPSITDINSIKDLGSDLQKKNLDDALDSALGSSKYKSVVVDNLQLLSPEAALILHKYCDNDNAPYKDILMILLLYVDPASQAESAHKVENYLKDLWHQGLDADKVGALMSRVANNVVLVSHEDVGTVSKICQS
ncbi:torsin-1A-interacting protein 1-like [Physella acuta]|uniref:torsin-1A-interacting protein 1-like n=1 Tax=Physella acuta TaxID=109671 RepID=UPI0027DD6FAA|nr:torsin-1A-interacting protein 1-like [Physella acuta]XP_059142827.1 torsin-1A-interacting protein 1-like [Physella acuta]XP_059142828.1 torsin-1A-interacting protein 1-like [Physella acuta]XP_059142829.1 torsin-1A-interacting protein 1-like [Physella acuta]XP_059142830.1 torsin-1A-interacting protein 1-like [Physella acuta]